MKHFLTTNISWLYGYFDKNKSLFEIFSFLMVAQSFMYGANLDELGQQSVSAFKIVLWTLIFLVIMLLQISTAVVLRRSGDKVVSTIFKGANFMKMLMRLLTLVLLVAAVPIFVKQIQSSIENSFFSVFYVSLALIAALEIVTFAVAILVPKRVE
jgi:hypothetical protein